MLAFNQLYLKLTFCPPSIFFITELIAKHYGIIFFAIKGQHHN